jgi:hypothetical protein
VQLDLVGMSDLCSIIARKSLFLLFLLPCDGQCGEVSDFGNMGFVRDVANSGSEVKNGFFEFELFSLFYFNVLIWYYVACAF